MVLSSKFASRVKLAARNGLKVIHVRIIRFNFGKYPSVHAITIKRREIVLRSK